VIHQWRVRGWIVEVCLVNGLLLGFSVPLHGQKENRIWAVNAGPLALLLYRP
jgi:hypothetical protein